MVVLHFILDARCGFRVTKNRVCGEMFVLRDHRDIEQLNGR